MDLHPRWEKQCVLNWHLSPFWKLQFIVWPVYGLVSFVGALPYVGLASHLDSIRSVLVNRAAFAAIGTVTFTLGALSYHAPVLFLVAFIVGGIGAAWVNEY